MNHDATFRPIFVVGFFTVFFIVLYYRIKSWASREKLDRQQEGVFIMVTLRLVGLVIWLRVIAYMIDPDWMSWSSWPLPIWLRWTRVELCAITVVLLAWTLHCLGVNLTDTVVTRENHTLFVRGPYRWVRHPFYDCMALLIVALSMISSNWFLLLTGGLVLILLVIRTRTEENKLTARFGDSYRTHMNQVGRFWPKISAM